MTFPLEIPSEQHRFILGKKGAGLKDIFDKTNVYVRIPNQEDNSSTIQVMGETAKIGEAITLIYKMVKSPDMYFIHSNLLLLGKCSDSCSNQCSTLDAWCSERRT